MNISEDTKANDAGAVTPGVGLQGGWSRSTGRRRPWLVAALVLAGGLIVTTWMVGAAASDVDEKALAHFQLLSERLEGEIKRRVDVAAYGLTGAKAVYASHGTVDRASFAAYVEARDLPREFPGVIGFGVIERVAPEDAAAYEQAQQADGASDFRIWSIPSGDSVATGQEAPADRYVIKHCFPRVRNAAAWGLDVASEPICWEAVERSIRTGEAAISGRITLAQATGAGFLYMMPVFRPGSAPRTPAERVEALECLVYAPILLSEVLNGVAEAAGGETDFEIFDGSEESAASAMYDDDGHVAAAMSRGGAPYQDRTFHARTPIRIGGRVWTLVTSTTPRFDATIDRSTPFLMGASGTLISLLSAAGVLVLMGARRRAETMAHEMTRDLANAKGRAEDALREVAAFRTALDKHAIISVTDAGGSITEANDLCCRISGYARGELLGSDLRTLGSPIHAADWTEVWKSLEAGEAWTGEVCHRAKDGSVYWAQTIISPFRNGEGRIERYISISNDITPRKRAEEELVRAREAAESASRAKSAFLANMSHEIRTPLTAILGFADLLHDEGDITSAPAHRVEAIRTIQTAGAHLVTVINDILDLSKIEADQMTIERIETSFVAILRDVVTMTRPRAAAKGLNVHVDFQTPVPETMVCDPTRLRQILMNLVGNAVKFTEQGGVTISAGVQQGATGERLLIEIADTGPGMTPDQAAQLFKPFKQGDETVTRKYGGTGLGLAICRRLADLMGGSVVLAWAEQGKGSCFRLDLPLSIPPGSEMVKSLETGRARSGTAPAASRATSRLHGRILLAEDGFDNQRLITLHLRNAGAEVDVARNGVEAIARIAQSRHEGWSYDLLLTDIEMPQMDGHTLARTLRSKGYTIPIIALTAHAMLEERARCLEAGFDGYASKPIDRSVLIETCASWMGKESSFRAGSQNSLS